MAVTEPRWWPIEYRAGGQIKRTNIHALTAEDALREAQRLLHWGKDFKSIAEGNDESTNQKDLRT